MRWSKPPTHLRKRKFKRNGKKTTSQAKWLEAREAQDKLIRRTLGVASFIQVSENGVKSIVFEDDEG
jgi:hypothetical protein